MGLQLVICLVLLLIMIQDFRFRAVHWVLFPVLLILIIADGLYVSKIHDYLASISINLLIILIQGLLLITYYKIQGTDLSIVMKRMFGIGDLLFIMIMAFAFTWSTFLFYYIAGLCFTLLIWVTIKRVSTTRSKLVPLAGLLSLYMIIIMLADIIFPDYNRCLDILSVF